MPSQITERIQRNLHLKTVYPNITVTQEIAHEFLAMNTERQRPVNNATVDKYTALMNKGEWEENGDVLRFSTTGQLLDGQHRCHAVIKSGKAQVWNIVTGLPPRVFDVIDIGKNRNVADVLSIAGIQYGQVVGPAVKIIMQYTELNMMRKSATSSNHEVLAWIEKHDARERLERCAKFSQQLFVKSKFITQSTYCAFLYILGRKDHEEAFFFMELLATGENISAESFSPIYVLRQKFINMSGMRAQDQSIKWALIIKSWNAFREKREIKQLNWNPDKEDFPEAI
jgi:hypothetical protein